MFGFPRLPPWPEQVKREGPDGRAFSHALLRAQMHSPVSICAAEVKQRSTAVCASRSAKSNIWTHHSMSREMHSNPPESDSAMYRRPSNGCLLLRESESAKPNKSAKLKTSLANKMTPPKARVECQ